MKRLNKQNEKGEQQKDRACVVRYSWHMMHLKNKKGNADLYIEAALLPGALNICIPLVYEKAGILHMLAWKEEVKKRSNWKKKYTAKSGDKEPIDMGNVI